MCWINTLGHDEVSSGRQFEAITPHKWRNWPPVTPSRVDYLKSPIPCCASTIRGIVKWNSKFNHVIFIIVESSFCMQAEVTSAPMPTQSTPATASLPNTKTKKPAGNIVMQLPSELPCIEKMSSSPWGYHIEANSIFRTNAKSILFFLSSIN